ncbi:hypothetical protein E5S69_27880 [Cupriavidus necator]|uniref:hypothetical protein n=1 Tax=Cupriavidus necator TaxID=106590 RepID=UPI00148FCFFE|nr:hypothetical protein [Cupriavidus necator]NOV27324.1 hypothetical protein [Cupriavidus necator]
MSAATGASKAVAEGWGKMRSPLRKTGRLYAMHAAFYACMRRVLAGGGSGYVCSGVGERRYYNLGMDKPVPRRPLRRTAWWVAFAALAGFLLADLT